MGSGDFNSSPCESVYICNTCSSIIKRANNTEWKLVTEDILKKKITDKQSNYGRNSKHFNTRETRAQNKINVYELARYRSLITTASICFRADILKSHYSSGMELMVEQSNLTRSLGLLLGCYYSKILLQIGIGSSTLRETLTILK